MAVKTCEYCCGEDNSCGCYARWLDRANRRKGFAPARWHSDRNLPTCIIPNKSRVTHRPQCPSCSTTVCLKRTPVAPALLSGPDSAESHMQPQESPSLTTHKHTDGELRRYLHHKQWGYRRRVALTTFRYSEYYNTLPPPLSRA
jgi:hypothetical protein